MVGYGRDGLTHPTGGDTACIIANVLSVSVGLPMIVSLASRSARQFSTRLALTIGLFGLLHAAPTLAQEAPAPVAEPPAAAAPATPQPVAMPQGETILLLIRTGLLTLNDALQTGNFTVLREMGAPGFAQANSAEKLKAVFANLNGMDLSSVATMAPKLSQAPALDPVSNRLRMTGVFPGQPIGIAFDLLFEPVNGKWRMFGIAVQPVKVTAAVAPDAKPVDTATAEPAAAPAKPVKAAKGKKKKAPAAAAAAPAPAPAP